MGHLGCRCHPSADRVTSLSANHRAIKMEKPMKAARPITFLFGILPLGIGIAFAQDASTTMPSDTTQPVTTMPDYSTSWLNAPRLSPFEAILWQKDVPQV